MRPVVSKGFGLNEISEINSSGNLNKIIFDHLNALFPAANGVMTDESGKRDGKNSFVNGAQGGTGESIYTEHWLIDISQGPATLLCASKNISLKTWT